MVNGIRVSDPRGLNKGRGSKFREGSRVRQTPEEGRRTYRLKRCEYNNKNEDSSPKSQNDKKNYHIYPTPPLGQDVTQGQFFKRSLTGLNSEFSFS